MNMLGMFRVENMSEDCEITYNFLQNMFSNTLISDDYENMQRLARAIYAFKAPLDKCIFNSEFTDRTLEEINESMRNSLNGKSQKNECKDISKENL